MNDLSDRVEHVARLIRFFTRPEMIRLLQLVPELRTISTEEDYIPAEQMTLLAYFRQKLAIQPRRPPSTQAHPSFLDVTADEFFALPEPDQLRLWQEAQRLSQRKLRQTYHPVRPDARFVR